MQLDHGIMDTLLEFVQGLLSAGDFSGAWVELNGDPIGSFFQDAV